MSSPQILAVTTDGSTSTLEYHSHPEEGVRESGWSQNSAQKSGAISAHSTDGYGVCAIGVNLHPDSTPYKVSKHW